MKTLFTVLLALLIAGSMYAQVGINNTGASPDPGAMLDVSATNKGLLVPRMTASQRDAISDPATGLLIFCTGINQYYFNMGTPGAKNWVMMNSQWSGSDSATWYGSGKVGIGTASPTASAALEISSTSQGLLPPRMSVFQRNAIANPVAGLIIYCTNCGPSGELQVYNGSVWTNVTGTPSGCGVYTINHVAGTVAPVSKTVTYGTVTNIPGEPAKCWITSNLGADRQASAVDDASEESAGWYWQFNRKQGFKHDGTTRTPSAWDPTNDNSSATWEASKDPCTIELGSTWRIPTSTEWTNVDASWTNWDGPWNSGLKLYAAGYLAYNTGSLNGRGSDGLYWSSSETTDPAKAWNLRFYNNLSFMWGDTKSYGFSVRCIKCVAPPAPTSGMHVPSPGQIIWNWNPVPGATGYKWHTSDDYGAATDMGIATTKTETGLTCETAYTRYVWAYNTCGNSTAVSITQSNTWCCGIEITINHIAGVVAPVTKSVTYGTVTNIPGEPAKCWITRNLGASQQATVVSDNTEASAGWYWQFNRKQGFKHDGTARTPNATWITGIDESSDWIAANDPCTIELGTGWRIPTNTEWTNVDASGNWTNWNGPFGSALKLHAAGYLYNGDGSLSYRGSLGTYWSSTQGGATDGWYLSFYSGHGSVGYNYKAYGFSARCLRDY